MTDRASRIFIEHARQLFDIETLDKIRNRFSTPSMIELERSNLSEREKKAISRGESTDSARMQDFWFDLWRGSDAIAKLIEAVHPFTWIMFPTQVRHIRHMSGQMVPWHQDAGYMKLHPAEKQHNRVITCFVPVESEPKRHTTLQFCTDNATSPDVIFAHEEMSGFGAGLRGDDYKTIFHYDLELGDALVFGDLALHRTFTPPGAIVERRSLEFRLIEPHDAIVGKDYFDIVQQVFVKNDGTTRRTINV